MATYIREFETTEALVNVINCGDRYAVRIQRYRPDFSVPHISTCVPNTLIIKDGISTRDLCKLLEDTFGLTNCYDLNDWRAV